MFRWSKLLLACAAFCFHLGPAGAQDASGFVSPELAALEEAHKRLSTAREFREQAELAKDLSEAFAAYAKQHKLTELAAQSDYFKLELRQANLESLEVGADILAGIYVEHLIERPFVENVMQFCAETENSCERNQAEVWANVIGGGTMVVLSGGGALPFYIFDQAALVHEAALEADGSHIDAQRATFDHLRSTIDLWEEGYLTKEEALQIVDESRSTVDAVPWFGADSAKMKILHDLVEVKLNKTWIGESLVLEGEVIGYAKAMTRVFGVDLVAYANEIAAELGIVNWPEEKATIECAVQKSRRCKSTRLYQTRPREINEMQARNSRDGWD